jgi:hypothetical protein
MKKAVRQQLDIELENADLAAADGRRDVAFAHLERAHILAQADTIEHTRVHYRMLKAGIAQRDGREVVGEVIRIAGATTKTPFGIYPKGNTGGANVSPFKPMPIPEDLKRILESNK